MNNQLYERDFNVWRETIIKQIKQQDFNDIDWEHLLLELEPTFRTPNCHRSKKPLK